MASLKEFLGDLRSKETVRNYRNAIVKFLAWVYDEPIQTDSARDIDRYDALSIRYIDEIMNGRSYTNDLKNFAKWVAKSGYSRSSGQGYYAAIKSWLEELDIEDDGFEVRLTRKRSKKIVDQLPRYGSAEEAAFTHDVIATLLLHADVRLRAIILMMCSSGMRIGEVLAVRFQDVNLENDPVTIRISDRIAKNNRCCNTFISSEAREALLEWLQVRGEWVDRASRRVKGLAESGYARHVDTSDQRIFPFSKSTILQSFVNTLARAGLDERESETLARRYKHHTHLFRKFFETTATVQNKRDLANYLMNHAGYMGNTYLNFTQEQLGQEYKKSLEPHLLVQIPHDYREMGVKVREYGDDILHLRTRNEVLEAKIAEMEQMVKTLVNYTKEQGAEIDGWKGRERAMREHAGVLAAEVLGTEEREAETEEREAEARERHMMKRLTRDELK